VSVWHTCDQCIPCYVMMLCDCLQASVRCVWGLHPRGATAQDPSAICPRHEYPGLWQSLLSQLLWCRPRQRCQNALQRAMRATWWWQLEALPPIPVVQLWTVLRNIFVILDLLTYPATVTAMLPRRYTACLYQWVLMLCHFLLRSVIKI